MVVSAVLGFCSIGIPSVLRLEVLPSSGLLTFLTATPSNISKLSFCALFAAGVIVGLIDPKRPFLYGLSSMAIFPVLAIIEKTNDITTHAHFPLEFLYYMLLSTAAIGGALLGKEIKKVR